MKLIVGLGNPGLLYEHNRHNIGFMCVNRFAKNHGIKLDRKLGQARTGTGTIAGEPVLIARPQTFMNASGEAVRWLMDRFKLVPDQLIVVHDDLDLSLGRIRIRGGGSSAGHRGIESIIEAIDSPNFIRVRVGVGHPPAETGDKQAAVIDHVLSEFTPEELVTISRTIVRVAEAVFCILTEGLSSAMNRFNGDIPQTDQPTDDRVTSD